MGNEDVILDSPRALAQDDTKSVCFISLVNLEEEAALRNQPLTERRNGKLFAVEPPVFLNLYLLFAFNFKPYATSLTRLGACIETFQKQRYFDAATQGGAAAIAFPTGLERLSFELVNMNFEALNHLWGILGGAHFPSVVYRVRLVRIEAADAARDQAEIVSIRLDLVTR